MQAFTRCSLHISPLGILWLFVYTRTIESHSIICTHTKPADQPQFMIRLRKIENNETTMYFPPHCYSIHVQWFEPLRCRRFSHTRNAFALRLFHSLSFTHTHTLCGAGFTSTCILCTADRVCVCVSTTCVLVLAVALATHCMLIYIRSQHMKHMKPYIALICLHDIVICMVVTYTPVEYTDNITLLHTFIRKQEMCNTWKYSVLCILCISKKKSSDINKMPFFIRICMNIITKRILKKKSRATQEW